LRLYNGTEAKAHASYTVWGNVPKCFLPMWNCTMDGFYKVNRESQLVSFDPSKVQTAFIRATHSAAPGYASPCKGRWYFASRLGSARAQPGTSVEEYTILVQGEGIITWAEIVRWWQVDRLEGFQKPSSPVLDLSILGVKSMCSIPFSPLSEKMCHGQSDEVRTVEQFRDARAKPDIIWPRYISATCHGQVAWWSSHEMGNLLNWPWYIQVNRGMIIPQCRNII
jgi:hypothetical protein